MTSTSQSLCCVTTEDRDYYLLTTEVQSDDGEVEEFDIALSDGESAWTGRVTAEDLERLNRKVHMDDYDDFVAQTRKALTKENTGNVNFIYEVKRSGDTAQFMWKKLIATENIKFQLGSTKLQEKGDPSPVVTEIFKYAISSIGDLKQEIKALQSDKGRLVSERESALKRLEKYVTAKEDIEQDLYSKFVVVLNDKKAKLRELRSENEALQAGASVAQSVDGGAVAGQSNRHADGEDGESGDETDVSGDQSAAVSKVKREYDSEFDTDEEEKPNKTQPKKQRKIKEEPRDTSGDSSLMLDAGEDEDEAPVTGRRRRQGGGASRRQTPSKPSIPKVPSSDKKATPSTSRQRSGRGSLRKNSSVHSKSSDNLDVDEMMDDI